jgi:hypothetical protein
VSVGEFDVNHGSDDLDDFAHLLRSCCLCHVICSPGPQDSAYILIAQGGSFWTRRDYVAEAPRPPR